VGTLTFLIIFNPVASNISEMIFRARMNKATFSTSLTMRCYRSGFIEERALRRSLRLLGAMLTARRLLTTRPALYSPPSPSPMGI
jgi:hypothetical protein